MDGTPMEGIVVLEPLTLSVLDVSLDSRPMAGNLDWNPLEHVVPEEQTRFRNGDGMLARWCLLLGQFSVTFEYRPGAQHANADGMSGQCIQCQRPNCPVSAMDSPVPDAEPETEMVDLLFAVSEMVTMVREWIQSGATPAWAECAGFSPELRCWRLQVGNLSIDTEGQLWRRRRWAHNWWSPE